jgi:hypothetical protein
MKPVIGKKVPVTNCHGGEKIKELIMEQSLGIKSLEWRE